MNGNLNLIMDINNRKNSTYVIVGVAIVFIIILIFQFISGPSDEYVLEMGKTRANRNEFFKTSLESPLPDSLKAGFEQLEYFSVDPSYRLMAEFLPSTEYQLIELPQAGGKPDFYENAGQVKFKLRGNTYFLTTFRQAEGGRKNLFIPFRDATSGKTTYGGGRYIDAQLIGEQVKLDFNSAYNPYCVYNLDYVCPIPPEENTLSIAIEAGEKMFGK
ncbi:MAG: DUF1684 domain-containing protein [Bacteroidia bacterium]|nr:DUF1684 domain-containing protein [Bacteroidia bacterium]